MFFLNLIALWGQPLLSSNSVKNKVLPSLDNKLPQSLQLRWSSKWLILVHEGSRGLSTVSLFWHPGAAFVQREHFRTFQPVTGALINYPLFCRLPVLLSTIQVRSATNPTWHSKDRVMSCLGWGVIAWGMIFQYMLWKWELPALQAEPVLVVFS